MIEWLDCDTIRMVKKVSALIGLRIYSSFDNIHSNVFQAKSKIDSVLAPLTNVAIIQKILL